MGSSTGKDDIFYGRDPWEVGLRAKTSRAHYPVGGKSKTSKPENSEISQPSFSEADLESQREHHLACPLPLV